jgi:hypothetical protein
MVVSDQMTCNDHWLPLNLSYGYTHEQHHANNSNLSIPNLGVVLMSDYWCDW